MLGYILTELCRYFIEKERDQPWQLGKSLEGNEGNAINVQVRMSQDLILI